MVNRPATVLRFLVPQIASVQSLDQRISKIQFQTTFLRSNGRTLDGRYLMKTEYSCSAEKLETVPSAGAQCFPHLLQGNHM